MVKRISGVSFLIEVLLYKLNQECREACGGQGLKTENRIGQAKSEYDVHSTFEGDNNVLMQQVQNRM